jgi:predicted nucleic acid-binding protein
MINVVIDTCVIIHIVRESPTGQNCLAQLALIDPNPNIIISVVTKAELESFSKQNNWGKSKLYKLNTFFQIATVIDVKSADNKLIEGYAQVDGYSKGRLPDQFGNFLSGSSKKMGKNDLWIAATAFALGVSLMTTDGDFDHLNGKLVNVLKVK